MKIYISGKITGDRRYKAKFREVEKKLAAAGHIVLNPATAPEGLRPVDYMRLCFAMMEAADIMLACMALYHVAEFATDKCRIIPLPGKDGG